METSTYRIMSRSQAVIAVPRWANRLVIGALILQIGGHPPAVARSTAQESARGTRQVRLAAEPAQDRAVAIRVSIDILPGESRNIVDTAAPDLISLAILGAPSFDPRSVDPVSLRLAGAAVVKNDDGATHLLEDVNADGLADLVAWFPARGLQLLETDDRAPLEGTTRAGTRLQGSDAILTLASALRAGAQTRMGDAAGLPTAAEEKLPALHVGIAILSPTPSSASGAAGRQVDPARALANDVPGRTGWRAGRGTTVALLGSPELDPRAIVLETIRVDGRPITKARPDTVVAFEDVNEDGREDLVVRAASVPSASSGQAPSASSGQAPSANSGQAKSAQAPESVAGGGGEVTVSALTVTGRAVRGETSGSVSAPTGGATEPQAEKPAAAFPSSEPAPASSDDSTTVPEVGADGAEPPSLPSPRLGLPDVSVTGRFPGSISLPDLSPASPYPATITMAGVAGVVSKVRVTLNGVIHTCFNDLDVLLVGPTGQSLVLTSDAGGCGMIPNATDLTFDDFAPGSLSPFVIPPNKGSYRPFNSVAGDPFAAPAPPPSGATAMSAFSGTNPNGDWKLYVMDDAAADTGTIRDGWTLDILTMTTVCSSAPITIPAGAPGTTQGTASLYPSTISVSGLPDTIAKVTVTLKGLSHPNPADLDIMLNTPSGQKVMLVSDAGGSVPASNLQVTLDDDAVNLVPIGMSSEAYHPTDFELGEVFPPPAPGPDYQPALDSQHGQPPNGDWELYIVDDTGGNVGSLTGWCVNITTIAHADTCQPFSFTIPAGAPGSTAGEAFPYPNTMLVTGTSGHLLDAQVRLIGVSHSYPDDLDILLQSPSGRKVMLMSDAGGGQDLFGQDLVFETGYPPTIPDEGPIGPGPHGPTDYEPGETMPGQAPPPPYSESLLDEMPNGDWNLWINDDAGADWGTISGGWCMSLRLHEPFPVNCSMGSLTIPTNAPGNTLGPAFPYPWVVRVTQQGTIIRAMQVSITNFSHTYPDDVDILLVGPRGQKTILMSDVGGDTDLVNRTIHFDDTALNALPDSVTFPNATWRPTNHGIDADTFPAPAPAGPYPVGLSVFTGTDPEGYWHLYAVDDAGADVGSAFEWCLNIWPLRAAGEATNLRWRTSSKTVLEWDAAPNAASYQVLRGTPAQLGGLLNNTVDSCIAVVDHRQIAEGLVSVPAPGSMFWYLAVATSGGVPGPAGRARIGSLETVRTADSGGSCGAP